MRRRRRRKSRQHFSMLGFFFSLSFTCFFFVFFLGRFFVAVGNFLFSVFFFFFFCRSLPLSSTQATRFTSFVEKVEKKSDFSFPFYFPCLLHGRYWLHFTENQYTSSVRAIAQWQCFSPWYCFSRGLLKNAQPYLSSRLVHTFQRF